MNEQELLANAIIYLRVSTKEQAQKGGEVEGYSIPAQRAACTRKAESLGARVAAEFVDAGESAKTSARPQLQAMLSRLSEGGIQYVIVHKVDRLARNRADDVTINLAITKAGARLVSVSENIDETPSGSLLHGIMSSVAEFYSKNLASEVLKGMRQKVQRGGTPGLAPIGYLNVPRMIDGRRLSTVEVDEERAHHIHWAFQAYATSQYSLTALTDMLAARGLMTIHRKSTPSRPMSRSQVHRMLKNKYYIGIVTWNGAEQEGVHTPIVSKQTFLQVQEVLNGHRLAGDRQREHNHYLRGSIWCKNCESRLIFSRNPNRFGTIYDYFFCAGHKQHNHCPVKYLDVENIERQIENKWRYVHLHPKYAELLRCLIREELEETFTNNELLKQSAAKQRAKIMKEQRKLLDAHYADAIPLDLLKTEQHRLADELDAVEKRLQNNELIVVNVERNLDYCLKLIEDCRAAYLVATPKIRRIFNQTVFDRFMVSVEFEIEARMTEPFGLVMSPNLLQPVEIKKQEKQPTSPVSVYSEADWADGVPALLKNGGWWDKINALPDMEGTSVRNFLKNIGLGWNNEHLVRVRGL